MTKEIPFSVDYAEAREKFFAACQNQGLDAHTHAHPLPGPAGIALSTDVAELGSTDAKRLLVINSATHGVEGFCGSAAIVQWLASGLKSKLPPDTRIILIHALNPHGFAWLSRVNEDNVDLNRNFIRNFRDVSDNPDYSNVHRHLHPDHWNEDCVISIRGELGAIAKRDGLLEMQSDVCRGQYRHPDGVFYGGSEISWSRRVFTDVVGSHAQKADTVMLIDFHTGLGPYGIPELISSAPPNEITACFSDKVTYAGHNNAVGPELTGTIGQGLRALTHASRFASLTAEFGTRDISRVLVSVIADNWLIAKQGAQVDAGHAIKQEIRDCFYPDEGQWKELVLQGSQRILDDALGALVG